MSDAPDKIAATALAVKRGETPIKSLDEKTQADVRSYLRRTPYRELRRIAEAEITQRRSSPRAPRAGLANSRSW